MSAIERLKKRKDKFFVELHEADTIKKLEELLRKKENKYKNWRRTEDKLLREMALIGRKMVAQRR